jgi:hypothetical protein
MKFCMIFWKNLEIEQFWSIRWMKLRWRYQRFILSPTLLSFGILVITLCSALRFGWCCTCWKAYEICWGPKHPRTGGWSLPSVMSDWQHGVEWLLTEHYRCRLRLDLHWCKWRVSVKGLSLAQPPRSAETSRLGSMDPVAERDQVRSAWWKEKQDEVVDRSGCTVAAHGRSLHAGLRWFTTKLLGYLVEPQNQYWRLQGWRRDPSASRSFDAGGLSHPIFRRKPNASHMCARITIFTHMIDSWV